MKNFYLALIALIVGIGATAAKKHSIRVDNIDPPYWWVGMANDTVQLLVNGPDIAATTFAVDYPGVKVAEEVNTDSPNYKLIYLTIAPDTKPGNVPLLFTLGKYKAKADFELKARTWKGTDNPGFDASDVLYLIMPDRFADGNPDNNNLKLRQPYAVDRSNLHARHGGDIKGIRDNMAYIDSLGVTAIWVNPVLENDMEGGSYHGYATTDYYRIDPRFGSNEEWAALVADAHGRGIKVVMDMIFNHSGSDHIWMEDAPMKDWFNHPGGDVMTSHRLVSLHDPYASDRDRDSALKGWFVKSMPDLNQGNRHLMNYLIQNSIFWIEDSKIDGIRMDTYPYADSEGMARWISAVEREYPKFNIVGECWFANEGSEAFWQRGSKVNPSDTNLPTVMDFRLMLDAPKAFADETLPWAEGLNTLYGHLTLDYLFPDPQRILTFLDNHDTDRFLVEMPSDLAKWKQAQAFLLTSRGIPQIYYGTEILMNGTRADGGDGNVRRDMPGGFPGDSITVFDGTGMTPLQAEAFDYLSRLLHWRKGAANEVIAKGSLKHFAPQQRAYIYERRLGDKAVDVILNGTDEPLTLDMEYYSEILPKGISLTDALTGNRLTIDDTLTLAPRQTLILQNF